MPTYSSALLPSTSGLTFGSSALRWSAYLQNVDIAGTITLNSTAFGQVFNVNVYGATGDGTTDDTVAIAAAIAAAVTAGGGVVYLPVGTYIVSSQVQIPNTVALLGTHPSKSIIKAKSTFPTSTAIVRIGNGSGIATGSFVRNLKIDCNDITGSIGVYTTEANEMSDIEKVTVTKYMTYGFHIKGATTGQFAIRDPYLLSSASATGSIGIYVDTTGGNKIYVIGGTHDNNGGIQQSAGIRTNGSTQLEVHDFHVEDCVDGVYFDTSSAGQADGIIGHNSVTNTVTVATTGEVVLLDINKNAGTNTINDTNKSITITENRVAIYATGHTNANLLTTATQTNRMCGLTVNNLADATQTVRINSGSAAAQITDIVFQSRLAATSIWKIEKDASEVFRIRDTVASDNTRLSFTTSGVTNFSAGGTSAVALQQNANAGTGGVTFGSGGASPSVVGSVDSTGKATFNGGIVSAAATPTVAASQLGLGSTVGFGTGAAGTAVTTTTKGGGTGPTTPQTVVNYLKVNIGGTDFYVPLVQ